MKTLLIAITLFVSTFISFSQETASNYSETIQPISINKITESKYTAKLQQAYDDLLGDILEHSSIDQNKKSEAISWQPTIKMLNGSTTKGTLIFPQGTIIVYKNSNTAVCLSKEFNEWAGEKKGVLDYINIFYSDPKSNIEFNN